MNNLREFYERALEVFGTSDEGELDSIVLQFKKNNFRQARSSVVLSA